ncbi:MAG TPA: rhamnan synthesis F family protein, partial [Bryobacteraceae bacterium]
MADALTHQRASWSTRRDLDLERSLISSSGLFDDEVYIEQAGEESRPDPIGHYVREGWRLGLEPNAFFPGERLRPYFASLGFDEPPAITWLTLRSAGWSLPASRGELERSLAKLRNSELFDEAFYRTQIGITANGLDPATHYIAVGEQTGIAPSAQFDPAYYGDRYPDVAQAGVGRLLHYIEHGRAERREGCPPRVSRRGRAIVDPDKENVLLIVHDTSRTGAPVLAWNIALHLARSYNLYTVHVGDGELTPEFEALSAEVHGPFPSANRSEIDVKYSLRALLDTRKFRYAIVNSAESRLFAEPCARSFIPTVLLMHEFASYVSPLSSLHSALDWCTEVVFPARVVAQSAEESCPLLRGRLTHVMPQGMAVLPAGKTSRNDASSSILEQLTYQHDIKGTFVVLGAGAVQIRKGVDLFLAAAAAVIRSQPDRAIHFLWVGNGFRPQEDMSCSVYLQEQVNRSGLTAHVTFLDAVPDLEPVYRIADAFLLSSRLDPLPNTSIDAAVRGIPVICFREASGTADLMLRDPETARGVVNYFDVQAAGQVILELAADEALRQRIAEATRRLAQTSFVDMQTYVAQLDALGTAAAARMAQRSADTETLLGDQTFDQHMFLGPSQVVETREETIVSYLAMAAARGQAYQHIPRPCPGFHPPIYAAAHAARLTDGTDPLADFVRYGKPAGPWQAMVLRPDDPDDQIHPSDRLRVALHAHFFYPDLAADFLAHLESNHTGCDLLISTDDNAKARRLQRVLAKYTAGIVDVRVVPNRGRDIGPLLTAFADDLIRYDLVGHVHAKRSPLIDDPTLGDRWREFLWQNLLGGYYPMMDRIVAAFERQDNLGLVFPSDRHLVG